MKPPAALLLALLLAPGLSGCLELLGLDGRPDHAVSRTPVREGAAWNTEGSFLVQVEEDVPVPVRIEARPEGGGRTLVAEGVSDAETPVSLAIPDGTWTIVYWVDGHEWERFEGARFDTTPPDLSGLETLLHAPQGSATLGAGAAVERGADVRVVEQSTGRVVATALPVALSGLPDGVHAYDVVATDPAGNEAVATVQVIAGSATRLPEPRFTAGLVARYTLEATFWDLTDLGAYATVADAQRATPRAAWQGTGRGITPGDPAVRAAIAEAGVTDGMTTAEAALALYRWMFDRLEYKVEDLERTDLLDPAQTIERGGGVCRDLAALYVSLLRGAGVPARLVAGYLAGDVQGFHAWVEFYGGLGPSAWVPVDVSGIGFSNRTGDDLYSDGAMLQAFGAALPGHLPLRALTPEQEQTEWSSAATLGWSKPREAADPQVEFAKDACSEARCGGFWEEQVLCVDGETRERRLAPDRTECDRSFIPRFPARALWVLDYGVEVERAAPGTTVTLSLVYPEPAATQDWQWYGGAFRTDAVAGRVSAEVEP